jgi:hypothetical protein
VSSPILAVLPMSKDKLKRAYEKLRSACQDLEDLRERPGGAQFGRIRYYVREACLLLERITGEESPSAVEPDSQPSP